MSRNDELARLDAPPEAYLSPLSTFAARSYATTGSLVEAILRLISEQLGLRTSFLTNIAVQENRNTVVTVVNQPGGCDLVAGSELPLHTTWCSVITGAAAPQPLLIPDAQHDPVFASHPAALSSPQIGAFIGVPICLSDGNLYGTLCAIDPQPQDLKPQQAELLVVLARIVATQIERDQESTARAAAEMERETLLQRAQTAVRERDAFLSIAAHELKTPLTSLLGYASLLRRRASNEKLLGERDQRTLLTIETQAQRLNTMVGDLLDVSRIEDDQLLSALAPLDLFELVERVTTEIMPTLTKHTLTINQPDRPLIVNGDQNRLMQVFRNLIGNAIKYSPNGGPVTVQVDGCAAQARVTVTDAGIGIPQSALPSLFQRFYRAPNGKAQTVSGFGIGLYIVREIVQRHGGTVDVSSTEGQGSEFTVQLPLLPDPQ